MDSSNIQELKNEQEQPKMLAPPAEMELVAPTSQSAPMPPMNSMGPVNSTVGVMVHREPSAGRYMYSVFHTIMSLVAIYLSFRCNKGFDTGSFLMACCCPYIYVIYILATKGTCGIIENESK